MEGGLVAVALTREEVDQIATKSAEHVIACKEKAVYFLDATGDVREMRASDELRSYMANPQQFEDNLSDYISTVGGLDEVVEVKVKEIIHATLVNIAPLSAPVGEMKERLHLALEEIAGNFMNLALDNLIECACGIRRPGSSGNPKPKPTRDDVRVEVWEERDRLHIGIQDKETGDYYASWWDDDARQMFDDGFFKLRPSLEESVLDYAEEMGILAKE